LFMRVSGLLAFQKEESHNESSDFPSLPRMSFRVIPATRLTACKHLS